MWFVIPPRDLSLVSRCCRESMWDIQISSGDAERRSLKGCVIRPAGLHGKVDKLGVIVSMLGGVCIISRALYVLL